MKDLLVNFLILTLAVLTTSSITAQGVAINETGDAPNAKAILDVSSTDKGILIPRITTANKNAMVLTAAEEGLMIYEIGVGFQYYDGTAWLSVGGGGGIDDLSDGSTQGLENLFIGLNAGDSITTGNTNLGIGRYALENTTTGSWNYGLGMSALENNTTGNSNTAIGYRSLQYNTVSSNTGLGYKTLLYTTTGKQNTAVGYNALMNNLTGDRNTAVGYRTLEANTTGMYNLAIGHKASHYSTTGENNIAIGHFAHRSNITGSFHIAIGRYADVASDTLVNTIVIGDSAIVNTSNTIQLGNLNITDVRTSGTIEALAFAATSDKRKKRDFKPLDNALANILQLNGYNYFWKNQFNKDQSLQLGVVAQEVQALYPELVYEDHDGYLSVNYNGLVPVLIEATKEQQGKIQRQENRISTLEDRLNEKDKDLIGLKAEIDQIKSMLNSTSQKD